MQFEFDLRLTEQQYLNYYRGAVRQVLVRSTQGARVQFPAALLTRFVTASGVQGRFLLTCDDAMQGATLRRLA